MFRNSLSAQLAMATLLVVSCLPDAGAQCGDWRARSGFYLRGAVHASVSWDPDGAGPQAPLLVVGGLFERAGAPGGVVANNVAAWDGDSWQSLGTGTNGAVFALTVYNGQLVAGGLFTNAGGQAANRIARWNPAAGVWESLSTGITGGTFTSVYAMTVYNNELIVGGEFESAGGQTAHGIARWNGTTWQTVGGHIGGLVYSLGVYNGELIAAGRFITAGGFSAMNIARWSPGPGWRSLGSGVGTVSSSVFDVAVYGNELIACGAFTTAGGLPANNVARWNGGAWQDLDSGLNNAAYSVGAYNGELYAGGNFTAADGEPIEHLARWDGSAWSSARNGPDDEVRSLEIHNGQLIVGGYFSRAGGNTVDALARWDGENWWDISGVANAATGVIMEMEVWKNRVVMAGNFHTHDAGQLIEFRNLVAWDGVGLSSPGTPDAAVYTLATAPGSPSFTTDLIVGGPFTSIDGVSAAHIARINDTTATGWRAMGAGFNGNVYAIAYYNGSIYAGGSFSMSGSTPVSRIARWNGTAWVPVGSGTDGVNGTVWALKVYGGQLYVGGSFNTAGGLTTGKLARWNGSSWNWVGGNFLGTFVEALEVYNGELVIGGFYPGVNSSPNLARWNGSSYSTFGVGGTDDAVRAMTVSDGTLVIGGDFTNVGGIAADYIARWTGSAWSAIEGGTDEEVFALTAFRNEIHVGGNFDSVRNGAIRSQRYARYSEDGVPWIAYQPASDTVDCGHQAGFHAFAAEGYGSVSYIWRKDGVPLVDGPTGTGSTIIVNGNDLYVQYAGPDDAGSYDVVISNGCGNETSDAVTLTVIHCCSEDLNGNGEVTLQDLALLLANFGETGSNLLGDIDSDNDVDLQDLAFLLAVFGTQCP